MNRLTLPCVSLCGKSSIVTELARFLFKGQIHYIRVLLKEHSWRGLVITSGANCIIYQKMAEIVSEFFFAEHRKSAIFVKGLMKPLSCFSTIYHQFAVGLTWLIVSSP